MLTKKMKQHIVAALRKAGRPDLAKIVAATQEQTVEYLKQAGILPPDEQSGAYPEIGRDATWGKLGQTPVAAKRTTARRQMKPAEAKRAIITAMLKAKRPDLANAVAKL
jgi:hypothetical protein